MLTRPHRQVVEIRNSVAPADLKPAEKAVKVWCAFHVPIDASYFLDFLKPTKEQEQISFSHTQLPQVRLGRARLPEHRSPALEAGHGSSVEIGI
jgi:hypothetical protein